ncbi:hypothetical protein D3C80_2133560 [compost metagenome]
MRQLPNKIIINAVAEGARSRFLLDDADLLQIFEIAANRLLVGKRKLLRHAAAA